MLKINLLPVRQLKKRAKAKTQLFSFTVLLVCFLVILGLVAYNQTQRVTVLKDSLAKLQQEKKKYLPILKKIKEIEKDKKELERKTDVIKQLKQDSSLTVRILDEVANIIDSERIWLLSLNQQGNSLTLSGMALDNQTVAQFMDNLKASSFVNTVNLSNSSLKAIAGRDLKTFSITCSISQPRSEQ